MGDMMKKQTVTFEAEVQLIVNDMVQEPVFVAHSQPMTLQDGDEVDLRLAWPSRCMAEALRKLIKKHGVRCHPDKKSKFVRLGFVWRTYLRRAGQRHFIAERRRQPFVFTSGDTLELDYRLKLESAAVRLLLL